MSAASPVAEPILVVGHRNPDTDAVCSALAYATFYQWQTGQPTVACYLDDLDPETDWLLQHLQLAPPRMISDVYLRVADVMDTRVPHLRPEQTLREAGTLMRDYAVSALPVVDPHDHLVGLVRREALADRYLEQLELSPEIDLPVDLLRRTLAAALVTGDPGTVLRDRVLIATLAAPRVREVVGAGDIVIVGDQPDIHRAAIEAGAGCLIVTEDAPLAAATVTAARARAVVLLRTHYSPFAAALLLQQSVPVGRVMEREPLSVHPDALLTDAQAAIRRSRLASLPVVDAHGALQGLLLRRHLAAQNRQRIILTDHNHPEQMAPGATESQIVAIVDHHNLGGLQTLTPLLILCEPVGCTSTLIAELFERTGSPLSPGLAGAMLGAILSDTVHFQSPTTTQRDRNAAGWLEQQSGEGAAALARALFRARLPDPVPPASWWVRSNWKVYTVGDHQLGIGQIELTDIEQVKPPTSELRRELQAAVREARVTTAFLLLTDILERRSVLLAADEAGEAIAQRAFGGAFVHGELALPDVMSRKQQVMPPLAAVLAAP
jgi:manganese-dependent inorganic pyrophosphatase